MTEVFITGLDNCVEIMEQKLVGYTAVSVGFTEVNWLPKYEVTATIRGVKVKQTVTFQSNPRLR